MYVDIIGIDVKFLSLLNSNIIFPVEILPVEIWLELPVVGRIEQNIIKWSS